MVGWDGMSRGGYFEGILKLDPVTVEVAVMSRLLLVSYIRKLRPVPCLAE